jgi:hypothetical protein
MLKDFKSGLRRIQQAQDFIAYRAKTALEYVQNKNNSYYAQNYHNDITIANVTSFPKF